MKPLTILLVTTCIIYVKAQKNNQNFQVDDGDISPTTHPLTSPNEYPEEDSEKKSKGTKEQIVTEALIPSEVNLATGTPVGHQSLKKRIRTPDVSL